VTRQKLDVKQAAQVLGISTDAVHKRVKRGSLDSEKSQDGRVYVWLDLDQNTLPNFREGAKEVLFAKVGNHYLNLNNVADVADNGDHLIVRFNFVNPNTQGPQALRVGGNEAQELRARLGDLAQSAPHT
jgi:hypothetical protein